MKEIPELSPYFVGLSPIDSMQLINIASHYATAAKKIITGPSQELSPDLDNEYIEKIVAAGLLEEQRAEYFLAEVAALVGQGKLSAKPENLCKKPRTLPKESKGFVDAIQQSQPFRPSAKILELINESVTRPHMYELLSETERAHIDQIGNALRKDVRERIQRRIVNDGVEFDPTPPDLSSFVQQVDHTKCTAGQEAISDIFAYMARDEITKTIQDAMRPQKQAEIA